MDNRFTVCVECKNHTKKHFWNRSRCMAFLNALLSKERNPVSGKSIRKVYLELYIVKGQRRIPTKSEYARCSFINGGHCPKFEAKESK